MRHVRRILGHVAVAVVCTGAAVLASPQAPTAADAARRGDMTALRAMLVTGTDASAAPGDGMTALHWAAERGDAAMVNVLVAAGASVSARTRIGDYTPLHLAARSGSGPAVAAILKAGGKVDVVTSTGAVQPLHLAAGSGSVEAVTLLLDAGAKVDAREAEWGQTPLIFAAAANRPEVIRLLVARGADVSLKTTPLDVGRFSTEARQAQTIQRQILANAVQRGQEPTPSQMQAAIEAAREYYVTGQVPAPPAPAAAAAGGGRGGRAGGAATPAAAATPAGARGAAPAAEPAAGTGAAPRDINEDGPPPNIAAKGGMSALHHAARQGYVEVVKGLLDAGASLDAKSGDGHSPLLIALINGQFDVAMELIRRGANVNLISDSHGVTPLWATVNARWQPRTRFPQPQEMDQQKANYIDVMTALLEKGADPDARIRVHPWYMVYTDCGNANCGLSNAAGATAFWRAAYGTDVEAMRLLVKYGADPNIPTFIMRAAGGRAGGAGARGGGAAGAGDGATPAVPAAPPLDPSGLPPVPNGGPGVSPLHAAAGAEYGEGFAGNAHHHAPGGWLATVKYLVEELGADVNGRDSDGFTPMHHAAARGDNEMILYFVSKGADPKAVARRGQTTVDMANGPVSRISPFPDTIALLEKMGAKNNHKCQSC